MNARFYRLNLKVEECDKEADSPVVTRSVFKQIGTEGGLLERPVDIPEDGLLLAPAERADIIADFRNYEGKYLKLYNDAPAPFPGKPDSPQRLAHKEVMQFQVVLPGTPDPFTLPTQLSSIEKYDHSVPHEHVESELFEDPDHPGMVFISKKDFHDPQNPDKFVPKDFHDGLVPDEFINFGSFMVWKFTNRTDDTHPIHLHLVQFQLLKRETLDSTQDTPELQKLHRIDENEGTDNQGTRIGCWKDTIRVNPNEVVSVMAKFDSYTGRYMYHCHILEHEDHDMMRPYIVMPAGLPMHMPGHHDMHSH